MQQLYSSVLVFIWFSKIYQICPEVCWAQQATLLISELIKGSLTKVKVSRYGYTGKGDITMQNGGGKKHLAKATRKINTYLSQRASLARI